jgi:hypothetical protein
MSYTKVISPNYETVGKRRRLTGFLGEVFDGETRISCFEYRTLSDAEVQTDLLVYELLSDPMRYSATQMDGAADPEPPEEEQGPCDDINITEPDRARCTTCDGEGRIPCGGYGDQAGGWAETCPDCAGRAVLV